MKTLRIFLDPGHGMSNRRSGSYDPGATVKVGREEITEAEIVMDWVNELRALLQARGHHVVRSRMNATDPAPVGERAAVALKHNCELFISFHCNAANGKAQGTETFYRSAAGQKLAAACQAAVLKGLGTKDRGLKTEQQSQHPRLAVLAHPVSCLIELGFIDHDGDRAKMLDEKLMLLTCGLLADAIEAAALQINLPSKPTR